VSILQQARQTCSSSGIAVNVSCPQVHKVRGCAYDPWEIRQISGEKIGKDKTGNVVYREVIRCADLVDSKCLKIIAG
jgi:hypothetical protein